jgi:peptide/nickel transport system permease protein
VAIPEAEVRETPFVPLEIDDDTPAPPPKSGKLIPILLTLAGIALILIAGWGIRSADTMIRVIVALAGLAVLWAGLQKLGEIRYGPTFKLGLIVAFAWVGLVLFCAIFAAWLPIEHWETADIPERLMRPGLRWPEPLGRTATGYSELTHVIYGARASLLIGFIAVLVGIVVGVLAGLVAGWYGKSLDHGIGILTNTILAFPPLILLLAIVAVYGSSIRNLGLALAVLSVPTYTRLMRAQTLSTRQREFVLAARAMGASNRRQMWREILPNSIIPVASYSFLVIGAVIVAEGSLSYLGVGIPPPQPSWGGMIADGQIKLKTDPHLVFVPAVVLFLTVLSFNRIGEWARKAVGEKGDGR